MTTTPELVARIAAAPAGGGPVRRVCVDGPAGSGKTTLARALADALSDPDGPGLDVRVVHGDEVYEGWPVVAGAADRVAAFALLAQRLDAWLLTPWASGSTATQPVWDWHAGEWGEPVEVPAAGVVVLDGVGLASRSLRERAALSIWVEAAEAVRLDRVLARDGESLRAEMLGWQADEQRWFALDGTRRGCDVRVRT